MAAVTKRPKAALREYAEADAKATLDAAKREPIETKGLDLGTPEEIEARFLYWGECEEEAARHHEDHCCFRIAVLCAIPISCDCHGMDVCPVQDKCTCKRGGIHFQNGDGTKTIIPGAQS